MFEILLSIINIPAKVLSMFLANFFLFCFAALLALLIIRPFIRFFMRERVSIGYESSKTITGRFLSKPFTPLYGFSGLIITLIKMFIFFIILSFAYAYGTLIVEYVKTNIFSFKSQPYLTGIMLASFLSAGVLFLGTDIQKIRHYIKNILDIPDIEIQNKKEKELKGLSLIGGYNNIKEQLKLAVENILSDNTVKLNGILLYGPPGCGKTYFAEKLAEEFNIKYKKIHLDEIKSMWMNESAERVGEIFRTAMNEAPCLIVFEEVDAILMRRDEKIHSEDKKVTNAFLTYMDDLRKSGAKVVVVATTNFYDKLDKASIRKGRFDFHIKINRPSKEDLKEIIPAITKSFVEKESIPVANTIQQKCKGKLEKTNTLFNAIALPLFFISLLSLSIYGATYVARPYLEKIRFLYEGTLLAFMSFVGFISSIGLFVYKKQAMKNLAESYQDELQKLSKEKLSQYSELFDIEKLSDYFEGRPTSEIKAAIEHAKLINNITTEGIIQADKEAKKLQRNAVPSVNWDEVIINEDIKEQLMKTVNVIANYKKYRKQLLTPPKGMILYGPPGTGKTLIAKAIASQADCSFYHIKANELITTYIGEGEKKISEVYVQARQTAPSIIFIDEADAVFGQRNSITSKTNTGLVNQVLQEIEGFEDDTDVVFTILATNYIENIDQALKSRLSLHLHIPKPNKSSREKLIKMFLSKIETQGEFNYDKLVTLTEGMSGREIRDLINRAVNLNIGKVLTEEMILNTIESEKGRQKPLLENQLTWDDLIVQPEIKRQLMVIEKIFREPEKAMALGISKNLNVMFYGPPGTGKTHAARVLASVVNADFKEVQSGELKHGIIGETERKIRELFEWLRSRPAAVLFIDEAESLLAPRENVRHEYSVSVVNQFLSELQGFREQSRGYHVVCISTNHPEMIDPAVLSRFTFQIYFPLPSFEERKQIIKKYLNINHKVNIDLLAQLTEGKAGRDIMNLIIEAKTSAFSDGRDYLIDEDFSEIVKFKNKQKERSDKVKK